jgi:DNA adenine methylase
MMPFIKWAGGKEQELKYIIPNLPENINRYYEPFIGGGATYFALSETVFNNSKKYINDKAIELIDLYNYIKSGNIKFFKKLEDLNHNWCVLSDVIKKHQEELLKIYNNYKSEKIDVVKLSEKLKKLIIDNAEDFNGLMRKQFNPQIELFVIRIHEALVRKIKRMRVLSNQKGDLAREDILSNIETAFKGAYYTHFRYLYNNKKKYKIEPEFCSAMFYFIREYCYASMFRYNGAGQFNVPYGGMAYNKKDFKRKIDYICSNDMKKYLANTTIGNDDFFDFLKKYPPKEKDFIFLDPPYDTEFSDYANNSFDKSDQERLAKFLIQTKANFMLIIKDTQFIRSIYENNGFYINKFSKKYMVNFQNRNERSVDHLLITNYKIEI